MSNPWAKSFEDLRAPYLAEKKAKKDYDGDGKIESGKKEYRGVIHNKIQKATGGKADGQDTSSVKESKAMKSFLDKKAKKLEGDKKKQSAPYKNNPAFGDPSHHSNKKNRMEHHQKDADGKVVEHEDDTTPSSVEEAKIDKIDPKNKRNRRNVAKFGKQTKPYDPPTKEMKTSMGKFMQKTRQDLHKNKRGVKSEEIVLESDKKGSGSGKKDACYKKVKASASVWPSAYASGRLVQCRKKGAANYGNSKKEEFDFRIKSFDELVGECWKTHKKVGMKMKGGKMVPDCRPKNEDHTPGNAEYDSIVKKIKDPKTPQEVKVGLDAGLTQGGHSSVLQTMIKDKKIKEAVKRPQLDIEKKKVNNKIEINPEIKTEAAKSPVKK